MLFKNTLAQSSSLFVGYIFSFLLAPIMIARLGLDAFGVWAVTGAFATYAGLLDLGIGRSLARFIAVFDADGDDRRIRECVGLGLLAVTFVGVLALLVAAALAPVLSDKLGVFDTEEMRIIALSSAAIWTFNGFDSALGAVGLGKRRMIPPNVAVTAALTINFCFSIAALAISSSLVVYSVANAAAALVGIVPTYFAMRYVWHSPFVALPSRTLVKEVLSFSIKNQIGWIADLVNFQTDKVIIAMVVDIRAAAVYEVASRVVISVRGAALMTLSAMVPTSAAAIVSEGKAVIHGLFSRFLVRSCALAFPLFMVVAVSSPFLLIAWLGEAPGDAELLVTVLTIGYLINLTTGAGSTIAMGAGLPGMVSANSALVAGLNLVLTLALSQVFGLWGIVAGTVISVVFGAILFNVRFLKRFELRWRDFYEGVALPGLLAIGLAILPAIFTLLVGTPDGRPAAIVGLAAIVLAYGLPYWVIATRKDLLPEKLRFPFPRDRQPATPAV